MLVLCVCGVHVVDERGCTCRLLFGLVSCTPMLCLGVLPMCPDLFVYLNFLFCYIASALFFCHARSFLFIECSKSTTIKINHIAIKSNGNKVHYLLSFLSSTKTQRCQ